MTSTFGKPIHHIIVIQIQVIFVLNLLDVLSPFLWLSGWGIDELNDPSHYNYSTFDLLYLGASIGKMTNLFTFETRRGCFS
jgi:hypothetical protein